MNKRPIDDRTLEQILDWEERFFAHVPSDLEHTSLKWTNWAFSKLGRAKQQLFLSQIDTLIIHIQAWLHNGRSHEETTKRIIQHARVFNHQIQDLKDLQLLNLEQLEYIVEQQMARQRLLAFSQGGLTGMGGAFFMAADLPAMVAINIRSIQQLAFTYGYNLDEPVEMMMALKLFHLTSLPKAFQEEAWLQLFEDVEIHRDQNLFYQGKEGIIEAEWLANLVKQVGKNLAISMLRKKMIQGVPLIGMAFGAGMNYRFAKQVIEISHMFYKKRFIMENYR
ncbi:EcsC family protein [Bacillus solitudinis]|uniref:EcsC family protein n=1 Tax=Bacillus solitudinis TaxID=2014074 RepID=UPI000C248E79|nr:EcsC family protein [Bacillus solitudinis]